MRQRRIANSRVSRVARRRFRTVPAPEIIINLSIAIAIGRSRVRKCGRDARDLASSESTIGASRVDRARARPGVIFRRSRAFLTARGRRRRRARRLSATRTRERDDLPRPRER